MLKLMDKKILTIVHSLLLFFFLGGGGGGGVGGGLNWTYDIAKLDKTTIKQSISSLYSSYHNMYH